MTGALARLGGQPLDAAWGEGRLLAAFMHPCDAVRCGARHGSARLLLLLFLLHWPLCTVLSGAHVAAATAPTAAGHGA